MLSQVTITDERAKVVDFSVPATSRPTRASSSRRARRSTSWDDVKKLKTVGVQASTTAEYYFTSGDEPGWKLDDVKSFPDLARRTRR